MSRNILLISTETFAKVTGVHGNIDPALIRPHIKAAQDMYILPALGSALYDKLLDLVASDSLTGKYQELVESYITDSLCYYTLLSVPTTISYQIWNIGVVRKAPQNSQVPTFSELSQLSKLYQDRAEFYLDRVIKYVQQNATSYFPEYNSPGDGIDTLVPDDTSFTVPIHLDDDDCHNCGRYCNCRKYR